MAGRTRMRIKVSWDAGLVGKTTVAPGGVVVPCSGNTTIGELSTKTAARARRRPGNDVPQDAADPDLYLEARREYCTAASTFLQQ